MGRLTSVYLLSTSVVVSAAPALRVMLAQSTPLQPRFVETEQDCLNATAEECVGGFAVFNAHIRRMSSEATHSIRALSLISMLQTTRSGLPIVPPIWHRLENDVGPLADPGFMTTEGVHNEVMDWMVSATVPLMQSNFRFTEDHERRFLEFYPYVRRLVVVDAGPHRVGFVGLYGPHIFVPTINAHVIVPQMVSAMVREGVTMVVIFCHGMLRYWGNDWRNTWLNIAEDHYSVNNKTVLVISPPNCRYPEPGETFSNFEDFCDSNTTVERLQRNVFLLPRTDSGSHLDAKWGNGRYFTVIDFSADLEVGLKPDGVASVDSFAPVPPEWQDEVYRSDQRELQLTLNSADGSLPIGESAEAMPDGRILEGDYDEVCRRDYCPMGDLMGRAVREIFPVDIVLVNGGALRYGWPAGTVTLGHVKGMVPYDNTICTFTTTGPEIWRILVKYASPVSADGSYNTTAEFRGGFPQTEGLRWEFDPARPYGQNVISADFFDRVSGEWEPLRRDRYYTVATSQFLCGGGDGYEFRIEEETLEVHTLTMQTVLLSYIRAHSPIHPRLDGRYAHPNSTKPSFSLPRLYMRDCRRTEYFEDTWEQCLPCPAGYEHDHTDPTTCSPTIVHGDEVVLGILLGIVGLSVIIAVPVTWHLTANWRHIRKLRSANVMAVKCAESIARMRLEEVEYIQRIPNPNELQSAFAAIIGILKEYSAFLPMSLRQEGKRGEAEENGENDSACWEEVEKESRWAEPVDQIGDKDVRTLRSSMSMEQSGSNAPSALHLNVSPEASFRSTGSVPLPLQTPHRSETSSASSFKLLGPALVMTTPSGLERACKVELTYDRDLLVKRVTALWVGLKRFHLKYEELGAGAFFTSYVDVISANVLASHGLVDAIMGDRILSFFGAQRCCSNQRVMSVECALRVCRQLETQSGRSVHCGADCGIAKVGTLGSQALRKHQVIGMLVNNSFAAYRIANAHQADLVVAYQLYQDTKIGFEYTACEAFASEKFGAAVFFALVKARARKERADEWMYQLAQNEAEDPHLLRNEDVLQLIRERPVESSNSPQMDVLEKLRSGADPTKISWDTAF
eukprot:Hpha_TRINITY_DN16350_c0_g1::TRINITY_DN16350_c0_g1_i1::g.61362::m.61362